MTRLWLTVLVLGFVAVCAIGCGRSDAASEQVCAYDSACHSGYHCGPGGVCLGDVACTSSAECCLAEQCVKGLCKRRQMCSQAAPCGKPSAICTKKMCVPGPCVSNDDCSAPLRCMVGTCRSASPCSGSCAAGSACAVQLNRCVKLHAAAPHCKVGELAVVLNEVSLFDEGCAAIAPVFGCHKLPALSPPQYGLVAKVVRLGTKLAVLAHERTHGDLLLALHGAAPPHSREDVRVVAGVPADAAVVADPSGPRGGVDAHGDTVGDTIAAARVGSGAHVAYHDATAHTLRYLALDAAGDVGNDHLVKALSGRAVALAEHSPETGRPIPSSLYQLGALRLAQDERGVARVALVAFHALDKCREAAEAGGESRDALELVDDEREVGRQRRSTHAESLGGKVGEARSAECRAAAEFGAEDRW